jgi:4-hydroxybenzoate polyprenyltransferase
MARSPASSAHPAFPAPAEGGVRTRSSAAALLVSLRPHQWTKNLLVFAGLIFATRLQDVASDVTAVEAFVIFCALSSVVYLMNDVKDREADRLHPTKSLRPIASGELSPAAAATVAGALGVVALAAAAAVNLPFAMAGGAYLLLNIAYSMWLKHVVIIDVLTLASGFVLRVIGGAVAIDVPFSEWLLLLTLLGALFIGLAKRRAELVVLADEAAGHRRILAEYSPYLLDQMIGVVTPSTVLAYAFYTISPETVQHFGTRGLFYTVPFTIYGIFRYLYLVHQRGGGGNPSDLFITDRPLFTCVALWGATVVIILYGPWR